MYVDDFLFNGSEQMLILQSAQATEPLQGFILTDLDACYVVDKVWVKGGTGHEERQKFRTIILALVSAHSSK